MNQPFTPEKSIRGIPEPDALDRDAFEVPLIRQYLRVAMRWRYLIIGSVVACLLVGLIGTLLITPKYTAITTVEIARESNKITDIQGVERDANVADQEFYQTQYGLLRSRSLAERIANHLRLVDDPAFFSRFGYQSNNPAFVLSTGRYSAQGRPLRLRIAGEILLLHVYVNPTRLSRLVDIAFTSPDPAFSAQVANAWATDFIQINLERRYQATSYARTFLESRLDQLRGRLEESERQLVRYATQQGIINLPGATTAQGDRLPERSIAADDLIAINTALAQATADRIQAQARYEQRGRAGATGTALENVAINNLRQKRAELAADYQRLMIQFEPEYPAAKAVAAQITQLDRSISREESRVNGSAEADYRAAVDREKALSNQVTSLKNGVLDLRRRSIQYNIFQRDVDTNRQLYDGLLQRYKEIGVAGGVGVNNVSIVDAADVPDRPSSPRLLLNLAVSLIAGLAIGGLLAFAREQINEAITGPREMKRELGLPLLGMIPKLTDKAPIIALHDRKSELVDAYLAVQTNMEFTTANGVPRSIAVTSTRPTEGKSTTSLAIAVGLARAHRRVILVDGDMRSPSVHQFAGIRHDHGLSNYLAGSDDIERLLHRMDPFNLTIMTSGPVPPNAGELLTGERLPGLLACLLESFDHVIVDSPPVMGLADAPLIASRVEGTVYVVEANGIRASLVRTALGRLASAHVRVIGGILTKFEAKRAHYEYGYEYGYNYGRDAQASEKVVSGG